MGEIHSQRQLEYNETCRPMIGFMKKWTPIWLGFVVSIAFAGWSLFQEPRP